MNKTCRISRDINNKWNIGFYETNTLCGFRRVEVKSLKDGKAKAKALGFTHAFLQHSHDQTPLV